MESLQIPTEDAPEVTFTGVGVAEGVAVVQRTREEEQVFYNQGLSDYVGGKRDTEAALYWVSQQQ